MEKRSDTTSVKKKKERNSLFNKKRNWWKLVKKNSRIFSFSYTLIETLERELIHGSVLILCFLYVFLCWNIISRWARWDVKNTRWSIFRLSNKLIHNFFLSILPVRRESSTDNGKTKRKRWLRNFFSSPGIYRRLQIED